MAETTRFACDDCGTEADAFRPRGEQELGPGQSGFQGQNQASDPIGSGHGIPGLPPNWLMVKVVRSLDTDERVAVDLDVQVCSYDCLEKAIKAAKKDTAAERGQVTKRNG